MSVDYRERLERTMRMTLEDEQRNHDWTYHAVRPMPMPPRTWKPGERVLGDCSKGCQYLCWWAGTPDDPMQQGWGPYGNSQTLWLHCQHLVDAHGRYDVRLLKVGDFVTFGADGDEHAACVLEAASEKNGWDPLLWSFGHQGAPNTYRLSADRRQQQYLRNPVPNFIPTQADKLRARTSWFAWVAWHEGEGDWRTYGAANKNVRPNVPKVIPLSWWKRRAKFLLNRKKPNPIGTGTKAVLAP